MLGKIKEKLPWLPDISEGKIKEFVDGLLDYGINGVGPISGSETLAQEYRDDNRYGTISERVDSMIKWETSKNFGTGFASGMGGLITLPISIPASMGISIILQIRLAGAIASLCGYSIEEDRVRTFILICLIGETGKELLKNTGVSIANSLASSAVKSIPAKVLMEINQKVGFNLLAKTSEKGVVNLMKIVPVAGGLVSGVIDSVSCFITGKSAKKIFSSEKPSELDEFYNLKFSEGQISNIVSSNNDSIKSVSIPEKDVVKIKFNHAPFSVKFKFAGFNSGEMTFTVNERFLIKGVVHFAIRHHIKKIEDEFGDLVTFKDNILAVKINYILEKYLMLASIAIKNLEILKGEIRVILK